MSRVSNTRRLRALIESVRDQQGWSYDEISRRSGRKIGKSLVHKLATETRRDDLLPVEQLRALAEGLGVSFGEVRNAALTDLGFLDDDEPPDVSAAIRSDEKLLPEARDHLLRQYALLLRLTQPAASEEELRRGMIADIDAAEDDEDHS